MIDKGNCESCGRKIQNSLFDKCMFCGASLPDNLKFTELEKNEIQARQQKTESDIINDIISKLNYENKKNNSDGIDCYTGDSPDSGD